MKKGYKYRLYPNKEQTVLINKTFGCVRFVYNKMLEDRISVYEQYKDNKEELKKQRYKLPAYFKKEYPWLKEADSLALANAQLNLQRAFSNFYRDESAGFPKFKSKRRGKKTYTTNNQHGTIRLIDDKTIRLPILKDVRIKLHRPLPEGAVIKSATISCTPTNKYFISIMVEYDAEITPVIPTIETVVGLDYSSASLYVDNKGQSPEYPKFYRKTESRLKKEQRKLSKRKQSGSNWDKQRQKVARLHEKAANQRRDFLHKLSRQITNAYDAVGVEGINMRSMAQCLNLAKSTNDNGFGMLRDFLTYKLSEQGKQLVVIDKWYPSSKICFPCKSIYHDLRLSDRVWACPECGAVLERDLNAANNIKYETCKILGLVS